MADSIRLTRVKKEIDYVKEWARLQKENKLSEITELEEGEYIVKEQG